MSRLFGAIRQIGMVVRDADSAMLQWIGRGIGPWYTLSFTVDDFIYRGERCEPPVLKLCFAHSGGIQLELIEQLNDVPSGYLEFLASGREGWQHVASWFEDHAGFQQKRRELLDRGFTIVHEGGLRAADASFTYFETDELGGLQIELSEAMTPISAGIWRRMLNETEEWDGVTDPIRSFQ